MEKKKHRFNIVDLVIILVVLGAAALLLRSFVFNAGGDAEGKKINLQYVIETDMISEDLADNVKAGDAVYDYESGRMIGTVTACDIRNATHVGMSDGGVQVVSDIVGYRSLYITVESPATGGPTGYYIDKLSISVGKDYALMLPELYCTGSCISAEVID
ncbi:MAG: DUF4330 domain-containing protein [Ruminococcaceae bacterium]|nr:DUF4330 domain-containing protein [Oscillospiraceae bacterium]